MSTAIPTINVNLIDQITKTSPAWTIQIVASIEQRSAPEIRSDNAISGTAMSFGSTTGTGPACGDEINFAELMALPLVFDSSKKQSGSYVGSDRCDRSRFKVIRVL